MPRTLPVESKNQWFQRVEALRRNRKKRSKYGAFVVEGVRSLNQLEANAAWGIEALLYSPDHPLSDWAQDRLDSSRAAVHLEVSAPLMAELSDKDEPSESLAVVTIPDDDAGRLGQGPNPLYVLVDQPSLSGNLGSLIRSCDALGVDGVVIFGHAADLYDPRTVRGAAGSLFSQPVARFNTWGTLWGWVDDLRARMPEVQLVGTTASGGVWPDAITFTKPTVLMVGNETVGLSHKIRELCDTLASIPMHGSASSLNLAAAATAILYEAVRQRKGS